MTNGDDRSVQLNTASKLLLVACACLAFGSNFWPGELWRAQVLDALGHPPYEGFQGLFLPHVLAYLTLTAIVSAVLWTILARRGFLPSPRLAINWRGSRLGLIGGVAALVVSLATVWALAPAGTMQWITPDGWKIAGNIFSNFYEEFVFRGLLLVALAAALGFWPAAILASAAWAFTHSQFPLPMQMLLVLVGIGWCWIAREARSLWAPYVAHMTLDVVADSLIG